MRRPLLVCLHLSYRRRKKILIITTRRSQRGFRLRFYCSNDIDSDAEGFLPSSCGKFDACFENCPGITQKRKRCSVRDLPCCTAAVSGNGLSITIVADDNFSSPDKPVSVSLNEASSFKRASAAEHIFVDRSTPCASAQPGSFQYM